MASEPACRTDVLFPLGIVIAAFGADGGSDCKALFVELIFVFIT